MNELFIDKILDRFEGKRYVVLTIIREELNPPDSFWKAIVDNNFGLGASILLNCYPSSYKIDFLCEALWEG